MSSEKPLVTISIPCYNSGKFIQQCLRSVFIQNYHNYEVVIVDDASTDNTIDIIRKFSKSYKMDEKIRLFSHSSNCGCGRTEKHAIEFGKGELVIILDSDDALATSNAIDVLVEAHKKHPEASLVYSDFYNCDGNLRIKKLRKCTEMVGKQTYLGRFVDGKYYGSKVLISHVKCFKRSFYDKTEGIDETLLKAVDKDLVLKLEEVGKFVHVPYALYYHRIHKDSISSSFKRRSRDEQHTINQSRVEMYRKAWGRRMQKSK